ncbi:hypothetical protein ACPVTF_03160 [Geobacillus icigianus]|uniref:Lipoprotein n=1 Tax=Geobacillus subterraneus TaxID=129338 RepID=A0A679FQV6_9BACL|nr:hypothetical protein [Geobacillus subterraneus]BBW97429.1 hypothetical protein GsuE55_22620 [Geobacillus subterraneus]
MKRILRYVLLCTMLAGCDHQEMSLQAHHWEAKRQGFDQEEIESLIREPESLNKVNRQLKNKDVASFFWLGMTKEEIRHMDGQEMDFFRARRAANQWNEPDEQAVKEIFKKQADHQMIQCHIEKQKLCTTSTIYTDHQKNIMKLTLSVSSLNREEHRYAVVLSYEWLIDPKEKETDFYGILTTENAVVDYHHVYSSYKTYQDRSHVSIQHSRKPYQSSVVGYMMKNSLRKESSRHFGYVYSEIVPSNRAQTYIDVEGFYVHAHRAWSDSDLFSFQDVYNWNGKADAVMFKSPVIRIFIQP